MSLDYAAACAALLAAVPPTAVDADVSIDPRPSAEGEAVGIDREFRPADTALWLGFIDLEPGRNWAHKALTVVIHDNGQVDIRDAQFPPALADGRRLRPLLPSAP